MNWRPSCRDVNSGAHGRQPIFLFYFILFLWFLWIWWTPMRKTSLGAFVLWVVFAGNITRSGKIGISFALPASMVKWSKEAGRESWKNVQNMARLREELPRGMSRRFEKSYYCHFFSCTKHEFQLRSRAREYWCSRRERYHCFRVSGLQHAVKMKCWPFVVFYKDYTHSRTLLKKKIFVVFHSHCGQWESQVWGWSRPKGI